jgi:hypothetical protein
MHYGDSPLWMQLGYCNEGHLVIRDGGGMQHETARHKMVLLAGLHRALAYASLNGCHEVTNSNMQHMTPSSQWMHCQPCKNS